MIPFRFCLAGLPSLRLSPAGRGLFVFILALLTLIALPRPAFASPHTETITVTTTDDELNQDGDCALREAVQAANTDAPVDACPGGNGNDTILLSSGTYGLTVTGGSEDANVTGDLDLLSTMTILGPGAETTFLNGNGIDRVLHIHTDVSVTLGKLTITGGGPQSGEDGGGILNLGNLVIQDSQIIANIAGIGDFDHANGGYGGGLANLGTAQLVGTSVSFNQGGRGNSVCVGSYRCPPDLGGYPGDPGNGGNGGGIFSSGPLILSDSTLRGNQTGAAGYYDGYDGLIVYAMSPGQGGGLFTTGQTGIANTTITGNNGGLAGGGIVNGGDLTVTDSMVSLNSGNNGGGLVNHGTAAVTHSTFERNRANDATEVACRYGCPGDAGGNGGGILNSGFLTLTLTSISSNRAGDAGSGNGGPGPIGGSGGGIYNQGTATIKDCAIVNNQAGNGAMVFDNGSWGGNSDGGHGGGIFSPGSLVLTNSTVSGNRAGSGGQFPYVTGTGGHGGGIYANNARISFSTVVSNSSGLGSGTGVPGQGGGVFNAATVNLIGVAFSANVSAGDGPSCAGSPSTSQGYNLIEDSQGCVITGTQALTATDILDQPAMFGPLRDNGGPTLTQEPAASSPAVDAVPWGACLDVDGTLLSTDQRGAARSQGAGCDMGAVERIMWVEVGPDVGATLVYTDTDGQTTTVQVPAGAFTATAQLTYRPAVNVIPPAFGWAATDIVFDLVAFPGETETNAQNRSDLRLSSPMQIQVDYDDGIYDGNPIIQNGKLDLLLQSQGAWYPSVQSCAGSDMLTASATFGSLQASTCETGHFLVAGATHSTALPLIFNSYVPK